MPLNEIEMHPFLWDQIEDFKTSNLKNYTKLIVGTFPIYALTNSIPDENKGMQKKVNWNTEASLPYVYGSKKNYLWRLFATSFQENIPVNKEEAIFLLNSNDFLITDTIASAFRLGYSPLDSNLRISTLNDAIIDIMKNAANLKMLYFTSVEAKKLFCLILGIKLDRSRDTFDTIYKNIYRSIILPSPAGTARTVPHFFNNFSLSDEERRLRVNQKSYALAYRQRYYTHYLNSCLQS